MFYVT